MAVSQINSALQQLMGFILKQLKTPSSSFKKHLPSKLHNLRNITFCFLHHETDAGKKPKVSPILPLLGPY